MSGPPFSVPVVQRWEPAEGVFTLRGDTRIVVETRDRGTLTTPVSVLAADVTAISGSRPLVVAGGDPVDGDVVLALDARLGEGHEIAVGEHVAIRGGSPRAVLHGTRTLVQWLQQARSLPAGTAQDAPRYPERGLMVDVGRKYFTLDWLRARMREMAELKLDYLHLHLSDDGGFRLESELHPEIVANEHYSKADIRELIRLGHELGVMVVPEIDMPGHMGAVLRAHPELRLVSDDGVPSVGGIDITLPGAERLVEDLLAEFVPLFEAPYWHMGADEYLGPAGYAAHAQLASAARSRYGADATPEDAFRGFIGWVDGMVRAAGRTTRVWNDGITSQRGAVEVPDGIVVEYWADRGLTPAEHVEDGRRLCNASWTPTYYVLGADAVTEPDVRYMYEGWTPRIFERRHTVDDPGAVLGAKLHVWCDHPETRTEDEIAAGIADATRVLAQQTWGSPQATPTYREFRALARSVTPATRAGVERVRPGSPG